MLNANIFSKPMISSKLSAAFYKVPFNMQCHGLSRAMPGWSERLKAHSSKLKASPPLKTTPKINLLCNLKP